MAGFAIPWISLPVGENTACLLCDNHAGCKIPQFVAGTNKGINGTGGHLSQERLDQLRQALREGAEASTTVKLLAPRYDETLADLDEVVTGKGDGVVAVKRGRLEGVTDVVLADFTHLNVLQGGESLQEDKVFQGVLQRLRD